MVRRSRPLDRVTAGAVLADAVDAFVARSEELGPMMGKGVRAWVKALGRLKRARAAYREASSRP
jgi:hypothetical protein